MCNFIIAYHLKGDNLLELDFSYNCYRGTSRNLWKSSLIGNSQLFIHVNIHLVFFPWVQIACHLVIAAFLSEPFPGAKSSCAHTVPVRVISWCAVAHTIRLANNERFCARKLGSVIEHVRYQQPGNEHAPFGVMSIAVCVGKFEDSPHKHL